MNVEVRKCREHIFETRMTEGILFRLKHSDPRDLKTVIYAQSILKGKNYG